LSRHRRDRVPLFIRRARRRFRIYRDHDFVWTCRDRYSTDGARPEYFGGNDRFISILAGRSFLLEIILAVRAALNSRGVFRRLSSAFRRRFTNPDRNSSAFSSATRLIFRRGDPPETVPPSKPTAIGVGAGLGFLSGLTGTGGGIFLTPLILFCQWAKIRQAAAVSALFILVNSIGGLVGYFTAVHSVPALGIYLAIPAIIGGTIGSYLGSRRLAPRGIAIFLAVVLVIAGTKLIFTR